MRKVLEVIDKFISDRSHLMHYLGGTVIFIIMLLAGAICSHQMWASGLCATVAVLAAMVSLEIKDKQYGNMFDWQDVLAGMVFPCVFWVGVVLSAIIEALGF